MADQDETTTAQRVLRLALALAGAVAAGLVWLLVGSSSAAAAQLDEPLTPVVEAVAEATEPVIAPVGEVAPVAAGELTDTVDPVVDPAADAVEEAVDVVEARVPALPATPPLDPVVTPLDPILDPVLDPLPGLVPELPEHAAPAPSAPTPSPASDEEPADDGAAAARTVIGPAIPDAHRLDRSSRSGSDRPAVASAPPTSSFEDRTSTAGDRALPGSPAATPSLASSNGTSASGGSSRGDPGQLAVLLAVAALALGSGRRVSWPSVDWRPLRFAALIERPG